jgi:tetratricopeptide (TPR) repeat protein
VEAIDHLNHRPHLIKTYTYLAMSRHGDALFEAQRAYELNPNDPDSLVGLGIVESRSGFPSEGIERLRQALRLNPLNPFQHVVHLHLAVASFLAKDYAKGVEWGMKCKLAAPEFVQNLNTLAENYVGLGRLEEAKKEFEAANRLAPDMLKARLTVGSPMYKLQEDREREAKFLRIAAGLEQPT